MILVEILICILSLAGHTMLSIRSLISSNLDLLQKTITRYEFDISAKNMNSILLVVFTGFSIFFALLRVFKLRR